MHKTIFPLVFITILLFSCSHKHSHEHEAEEDGLEALAYTLYTERTELFVEFKPLIAGTESRFAAHFTKLGENFKAFTEGNITLTVAVNGKQVSVTATKPEVPGIFRLRLTPNTTGIARLIFDIKTKDFTDQIIIDSIMVYADEQTAMAAQPEPEGGNDITYLKEQAWKVEFANAPLKRQPFSSILKTSGLVLSAPGDEVIITSEINGIVTFAGSDNIAGNFITAGALLYKVKNSNLIEGSVNADLKSAEENLKTAQANYERASELIKDKIISQKEFLDAKLNVENAKTILDQNKGSRSFYSTSQNITSPISGYIKSILVTQGELVTTGQQLATISKNKKLLLQANVSQKHFDELSSITSANFRTAESETIYSTSQLNGKIISYGKSTSGYAPFIPVTFEMDNTINLIPGSVAEIYLKSAPLPNALIVPVSSLIEEQGNFFVYIQTGGESFQKREVKIGASDGINVQLLSGVEEGERVVTKGAYQIKLSSASGTLPAHGHEH